MPRVRDVEICESCGRKFDLLPVKTLPPPHNSQKPPIPENLIFIGGFIVIVLFVGFLIAAILLNPY